MNIIGWIREGDSAACGASVKLGHPTYTSHGKALAHHGSPMACPYNCVVTAGEHHFTLPDGLPQALHGDKTSGGCPLASTLNGIHGIADPSGAPLVTAYFQPAADALATGDGAPEAVADAPWLPGQYDDRYVLLGVSDGKPLAHAAYAIERDDGSIEHGTTDAGGHTHLLKQTLEAEHVRIYLEDNV
ncbi:PAAR domain-containing protein [Massilia sp. DJPM01]|uniref:PAAR domain-containing protein n=1 Tax=Massilia sp. DJPM01 TaxID=3024404 RepID=UPI00259E3065|nr:PAAR domain-containing protein [Massilia sp. DJPM01]MDM5179108.1 PAAR domain-containing protein [Massilia sp. DJPM01]